MSHKLKGYLYSLLFLLISHLILASLLAFLLYYCVLSPKSYELISMLVSLPLWIFAGVILGRFLYQKALLSALPIIICYLGIAILLLFRSATFSLPELSLALLRMFLFGAATRIGMRKN